MLPVNRLIRRLGLNATYVRSKTTTTTIRDPQHQKKENINQAAARRARNRDTPASLLILRCSCPSRRLRSGHLRPF